MNNYLLRQYNNRYQKCPLKVFQMRQQQIPIVTKKCPLKVFQMRQQQIPREKFRRVQSIHVQFTVSYNEKSSRTNAEGSPRSIAEVSFVSSTISFGQPLREAVPSFRFRFPDALLVRRLDYAGI